jgi:uncharacterized protein YuzE
MRLTYDSEINALYIQISDEAAADTLDYQPGIAAHVTADGRVIGIEILDLHEHLKVAEQTLDELLGEAVATD